MDDHTKQQYIDYFKSRVRKHEYRPCSPPVPPDKVDICGDCGFPKDEHPSFWLHVGSAYDQKTMGRLMMEL